MSDFNLSFTPLLPWPLFAVLGLCALAVVGLGFYARRRGTALRALGFALLLLALTDPAIIREDRNPLKDVIAVVVDRSGSQTIGERPEQTEKAKDALVKSLNALSNVDVRVIESARTDAGSDGTQLFSALNAGLADVPAERVGGVFMITDGVVHDIPKDAEALGIKAPLHALITAMRASVTGASSFWRRRALALSARIRRSNCALTIHATRMSLWCCMCAVTATQLPMSRRVRASVSAFRCGSNMAARMLSRSKSMRCQTNSPQSTIRPC